MLTEKYVSKYNLLALDIRMLLPRWLKPLPGQLLFC